MDCEEIYNNVISKLDLCSSQIEVELSSINEYSTDMSINEDESLKTEVLSDVLYKINKNLKILKDAKLLNLTPCIQQGIIDNTNTLLYSSVVTIDALDEKKLFIISGMMINVWRDIYFWNKKYFKNELSVKITNFQEIITCLKLKTLNSDFESIKILTTNIITYINKSFSGEEITTIDNLSMIKFRLKQIENILKKNSILKTSNIYKNLIEFKILFNAWKRKWNTSNVFFRKYYTKFFIDKSIT
jgi:hypothetical protein